MKRQVRLLTTALLALGLMAAPAGQAVEGPKATAFAAIDRNTDEIAKVGDAIFSFAELGMQEVETSAEEQGLDRRQRRAVARLEADTDREVEQTRRLVAARRLRLPEGYGLAELTRRAAHDRPLCAIITAMRTLNRTLSHALAAALMGAVTLVAQTPAVQDPAADLLKQGQGRMREGKHDEALALFKKAVDAAPDSYQANSQVGVVLDLMGQYAEARKSLAKAIEVAPTIENKTRAYRSMAMSYAFESNCQGATKYASQAYDIFLAAKDAFNTGEVANELARICLESGDFNVAYTWYQTGRDQGLREPDIKPERKDLWEFRWEHAQARIAARRGNGAEARKHVAAAKAILDKGTNPDQAPFFPYLTGYVAFYGGDYKTALAELQKANQNDPFILSLIAQTCEKLGDDAQAKEYYKKILASNAHNPTNAFARPLAKKKLGG